MDRDFAIGIHKQLHEISIAHMQGLKANGTKGEDLQKELQFLPVILGDKLYVATGVEPHELDCQTTQLGLEENDEEYKKMEIDYATRVKQI